MFQLIDALGPIIGLGRVLLIPHVLAFLVGLGIWSWMSPSRNLASLLLDALCVLAALAASLVFLVLMLDQDPPSAEGNAASWFMIFSVMTVGLVPLVTMTCFLLSGRLAGRLVARMRTRQHGATATPQP